MRGSRGNAARRSYIRSVGQTQMNDARGKGAPLISPSVHVRDDFNRMRGAPVTRAPHVLCDRAGTMLQARP
jgi:hypothetical protein